MSMSHYKISFKSLRSPGVRRNSVPCRVLLTVYLRVTLFWPEAGSKAKFLLIGLLLYLFIENTREKRYDFVSYLFSTYMTLAHETQDLKL